MGWNEGYSLLFLRLFPFSFVFRQHVSHVKIYSIHQNNVDVILKCRTENIVERKIFVSFMCVCNIFSKFRYSKCETITDIVFSSIYPSPTSSDTNSIKIMPKILSLPFWKLCNSVTYFFFFMPDLTYFKRHK